MNRILPQRIGGRFAAPPSKSEAQRLLLCAALADAPTTILCPAVSQDILQMSAGLSALGASIVRTAEGFAVTPLTAPPRTAAIDCGESGAVLRFLLPLAAALGVETEFRRSARLAERPIAPLAALLESHGCRLAELPDGRLLLRGRLRRGHIRFTIDGAVSSQFVSGLLMALPLLGNEIGLTVLPPVVSADYITLTTEVLLRFGVVWGATPDGFCLLADQRFHAPQQPLTAHGDWSGAAALLCAGAISAPVTVTGLDLASRQPDREILTLLTRFGASVETRDGAVTVAPQRLHGIRATLEGYPDLLPPLAAVAAAAEGETRLFGVARLRWKESDRPAVLAAMLRALGGEAAVQGDCLVIRGGRLLRGGTVSACGDHRIAMAAALLACQCAAPLTLEGAQCVEKSYPQFWTQLEESQ